MKRLVIDFDDETADLYGHVGYSVPVSPIGSFSYSVGTVFNYEEPGDYAGAFVNAGATYNWLGVDYCRSPDMNENSVSALSITFGIPGPSKFSGYLGIDDFWQIGCWDFGS